MMKVLTIAATSFFSDRGCHMRIYGDAKYLEKFGAEVKICTYFSGDDIAGLDIERIGKVGWYKRTAPGFSWGKFWLDIKLIFLCRRVIREFRPDIIHGHMYEGFGVGYVAKRLTFQNPPVVVDLQADLEEEFKSYNRKNFIARRFFVWLSRRLINRCNWLVVSSENVKPRMEKLYKHKDKISIVRDGIDLDLFRNVLRLTEEEQAKIAEIKKWTEGKKLLVYIGGLSDNKGVGDLLEAFLRLNLKNAEWRLLIGGFGNDEEKYKEYVRKNNLGDFVYFAGRVKYFSLPAYLALASAAIDPKNGSTTEGSGKLVNLMAAGCPIVCFEKEFNRARLGEKGHYMQNFGDLAGILESIKTSEKIHYDMEELGEEKEAKKLFDIFEKLIKK
ncbi:MAG TPA: glycosyltransferase [Candidatus Saccharimonadales bacterium]|nr:glycosyltransferase [Candidatus Saccharimonadales bacterium]